MAKPVHCAAAASQRSRCGEARRRCAQGVAARYRSDPEHDGVAGREGAEGPHCPPAGSRFRIHLPGSPA